MRILLTGAAGPAGRSLLRQLDPVAHTIIAADMAAIPPSELPAGVLAVTVPAAADPAMLPTLARLVAEHRIDLVIPTVSDELPQIAEAADAGESAPVVAISGPEAVRTCHDKLLTARALAAAGVAVPRFALPSELPDTAAALRALGAPLILKPRIARGGRGVRIVEAAEDIDWSTLDDSWIVQEMAPGTEYAPMVHRHRCDPTGPTSTADEVDGACAVVLEKTGLKEGRVGNATGVRRLEGADVADVAALALATARALDLRGAVDIDVRRTVDGRPVVLEVNARFGANSEHAPEMLEATLAEAARTRTAHVHTASADLAGAAR